MTMKNSITFQLTKAILSFSFLLYTISIHAEVVKPNIEKEAVAVEQQSKANSKRKKVKI